MSDSVSWLQFVDWLEGSLDIWGLDAPLYSRCVLSILRQPHPPSPMDRSGSIDAEELVLGWGAGVCGRNGNLTVRIPSSPTMKRVNVVTPAQEDGRPQALNECLKSVDNEGMDVSGFVCEILTRYMAMDASVVEGAQFVKINNDSVDSGVCPSPEDNTQNYDEAFPPLADEESLPGDSNYVRAGVWRSQPVPVPIPNNNIQECVTPVVTNSAPFSVSVGPLSWKMPRVLSTGSYSSCGIRAVPAGTNKRRKIASGETGGFCSVVPFTTEWTRQLHSCPSDMPAKIGVARWSPAPKFVVPKCAKATNKSSEKVGSCPMRLEFSYSGPPLFTDTTTIKETIARSTTPHLTGSEGFDVPRFILDVINEDKREPQPPVATKWSMEYGDTISHVQHEQFTNVTAAHDPFSCVTQNPWAPAFLNPDSEYKQDQHSLYDFCMPKGFDQLLPPVPKPVTSPMRGTVAVSPSTHFLPIKSDSLDEAYFARPLLQCTKHSCPTQCQRSLCYAMGYYREEEYYVLRQSVNNDHNQDSLPLKFKASLPEKEVQTDPEIGGDAMSWGQMVDMVWQPMQHTDNNLLQPWNTNNNVINVSNDDWCLSQQGVCESLQPSPPYSPVFAVEMCVDNVQDDDSWTLRAQQEDEMEADQLLRIVGNISLVSPLKDIKHTHNVLGVGLDEL